MEQFAFGAARNELNLAGARHAGADGPVDRDGGAAVAGERHPERGGRAVLAAFAFDDEKLARWAAAEDRHPAVAAGDSHGGGDVLRDCGPAQAIGHRRRSYATSTRTDRGGC